MASKLAMISLGACMALAPHAALAAGAMDAPEAVKFDPDYAAGKAAIDARNWGAAIKSLTIAAQRDPNNADIQNFLGYANRKLGQLDLAFKYYGRALEIDPKHRGAHEYVGEAYLMANNLAKAEEHLAALDKICFLPCEEYTDLKNEVAEYKLKNKK